MKFNRMLLPMLAFGTLVLTSCGNAGFSYDYGYGAVSIELDEMKIITKTNYTFTDKEALPWGRYLSYKATYTNIAYYWQELPHHHYYLDRIPSKETSTYLNGYVTITCDAPTIEREETVHCDYLVLITTNQNINWDGLVNIFVTNQKLERLFYISTNIVNYKISLYE